MFIITANRQINICQRNVPQIKIVVFRLQKNTWSMINTNVLNIRHFNMQVRFYIQ